MKISKERWEALKRRASGHYNKNKSHYKEALVAGGTGAAVRLISEKAIAPMATVQKYPWIEPLGYAVAGHFIGKKSRAAGNAMLGIAGYLGAGVLMRKMEATATPPATASGWGDAGILVDASANDEASALASEAYSPPAMGPYDAGILVDASAGDEANEADVSAAYAFQD